MVDKWIGDSANEQIAEAKQVGCTYQTKSPYQTQKVTIGLIKQKDSQRLTWRAMLGHESIF